MTPVLVLFVAFWMPPNPPCHPICVQTLMEDKVLKNFEFSLMELMQRTDAALVQETVRESPDRLKLIWLRRRRKQFAARLQRSLISPMLAGA